MQIDKLEYKLHTPTLTQTSLGGHHLSDSLTQLAKGLGRNFNNRKDIKTQIEYIAVGLSQTHLETTYT